MAWNREGSTILADYLGTRVEGRITESRVKYGGRVGHTVALAAPIEVFGRIADVVLIEEADILEVL